MMTHLALSLHFWERRQQGGRILHQYLHPRFVDTFKHVPNAKTNILIWLFGGLI
jgi:hypothetical protein